MTETIVWPTKTWELHNHHFDSTIWNDLRLHRTATLKPPYAFSYNAPKPGSSPIYANPDKLTS